MSHTVGHSTSGEIFCNSQVKNSNIQQEVNDLLEIIKLERRNFHAHNILYELVYECGKNGKDANLKEKVEEFVLPVKVQPCLEIGNINTNKTSTFTILGLSDIHSTELNYEERHKLRNSVQQALSRRYSNLVSDLTEITGQHCDTLISNSQSNYRLSLSPEDKVLFEQKMQLNEQQRIYFDNLIEYYNILEKFIELRIQDLPKYCHNKVEEFGLLKKMYGLRAQVLNEKLRTQVFSETRSCVVSYKELIKDIKKQQEQCKDDINNLEELKEKYKQISCKQFKEILSSYKQYLSRFEKLKKVHEQLNLR